MQKKLAQKCGVLLMSGVILNWFEKDWRNLHRGINVINSRRILCHLQ